VALGVVVLGVVVLTPADADVALGVLVLGLVAVNPAKRVALGVVGDAGRWVFILYGVPSFLLPGLPPRKTSCG
jgi:hypothetical protein